MSLWRCQKSTIGQPHTESERFVEEHSRRIQWLTILSFLTLSSLTFAVFFELDRYGLIVDPSSDRMTLFDKVLLFLGIVAKSHVFFVPILVISGCFIALGLFKTANLIVITLWGVAFFFMTADLVAISFQSFHIWEYLPETRSNGDSPFLWIWRMTGERIKGEAAFVLACCAIAPPIFFFATRWLTKGLVLRYQFLDSQTFLKGFTASLVLSIFGILTVPQLLRETTYASMPMPHPMRQSLERFVEDMEDLVRKDKLPSIAFDPFIGGQIPAEIVSASDELYVADILRKGLEPKPPDPSAFVRKPDLPNVILIVLESFRYDAVRRDSMNALDEWSRQGLRLERHYSGSNATELGLFSLLYGRLPFRFDQVMERRISGQMSESLRRSGYKITCLRPGELGDFLRLNEFCSPINCDDDIQEGRYTLNARDMQDWPDSDRRKLAHVRAVVNAPLGKPQFLLVHLISSHYNYAFPPEFGMFKETPTMWRFLNSSFQIQNHRSRYANSVLFLEHELMDFINSIDPKRNIIIVTGDHGQSMKEDGVFTHRSRRSDIQMRVPFIMVGSGVDPRKISTATAHYDVLPTLLHALAGGQVPVMNCDGRDLLADPNPADEVLVLPVHLRALEPLLIRGNNRMLFKLVDLQGEAPKLEFSGLVDELGQYKYKVCRSRRQLGAIPLNGSPPSVVSP